LNSAFRIWASLVSLAVIVQVGLAAYGGFHAADEADDKGAIGKKTVEHGFSPHSALGYAIFLAAIVLLLLAFAARSSGASDRVKWSALIAGLVLVQILLAWLGDAVAWLGVLHGMNALAIAGLAGSLAGREWAAYRGAVRPAQ
jgi:hypothetical protein